MRIAVSEYDKKQHRFNNVCVKLNDDQKYWDIYSWAKPGVIWELKKFGVKIENVNDVLGENK